MCGIIGISSYRDTPQLLLEALKRLEYRGYDSAGIATVSGNGLHTLRAEGKLANLSQKFEKSDICGHTGIGHTRWATHGVPSEANAHPHRTDKVAVVHNGIIENYRELKDELTAKGYSFKSQTDTEVVPVLITSYLEMGDSPKEAVAKALRKLHGAYALGIIFTDHPSLMIAARRGSPLAIGYGEKEMFIGSDAVALAGFTNRICYLDEGDWAVIDAGSATIFDQNDKPVDRPVKTSSHTGATIGKGNYRHYMQKEIHEQPSVIGQTLNVFYNASEGGIHLPNLPFPLEGVKKITLIACGTSYFAAMVARYWIEQLARIPVELDIASEFRYRSPVFNEGGVAIFISQSGETADTLAALRLCKSNGQKIIGIVNVAESSIANESDLVIPTYAGPEIGVASTKAFTTQLVTLACLTLALAKAQNKLSPEAINKLCHALAEVPARAVEILHHEDHIALLATHLMDARDMLYIGRGTSYAIAMEGALKMKEISYIHAEGYAAGELKHGPIALIDEHVPVVVFAPTDPWFEKTASNVQEAVARGGKIILISDEAGIKKIGDLAAHHVVIPSVDAFVTPVLYALPAQLLAYHVAVLKGTDVDQPRNLAKSVTVE